MKFANTIFTVAGVYGLLVLVPQYFLEEKTGLDNPPPINHPEYYYGFIGVAVAWQVVFLVLGRDPVRYRPLMIPAVLEKATFGIACIVLYLQNRLAPLTLGFGVLDLILGALFITAYLRTPARAA